MIVVMTTLENRDESSVLEGVLEGMGGEERTKENQTVSNRLSFVHVRQPRKRHRTNTRQALSYVCNSDTVRLRYYIAH